MIAFINSKIDSKQDKLFYGIVFTFSLLFLCLRIFIWLYSPSETTGFIGILDNNAIDFHLQKKKNTKKVPTIQPKIEQKRKKPLRIRKVYNSKAQKLDIDKENIKPYQDTISLDNNLKGDLSSVIYITKKPIRENVVVPEYTLEMRENNIEGIIYANILIDVDGKVKKIIFLNDLGHGSRSISKEAILKTKFSPAYVKEKLVALWIPYSFSYELEKE